MNIIKRKSKLIYMLLFCFLYIVFAIYLGAIPGLGYPVEPILIGETGGAFKYGNYLNYIGNTSFPFGLHLSEGFGIYLLGEIFIAMGCNAMLATQLGFLLLYTVSFFSMKWLIEHISGSSAIAAVCVILFFFDPFLTAQRGIPYMLYGILMLPAVLVVEYKNCNRFICKEEKKFDGVLWGANLIIKLIAVSMGWYIAVISAVATCIIALIYIIQEIHQKKLGVKHSAKVYLLYVVSPWIISMFAIIAITPSTVTDAVFATETYLGSAIDSSTLFLPDSGQFIANIFPTATDLLGGESLTGDGTMWSNYLGVTMVIVAVYLLFQKGTHETLKRALIVVGLIGLILSFGPGIKFLAGVAADEVPQYEYSLENVLVFPWAKAFPNIFPLSMMRATYRWIVITKVSLILLFSIFLKTIRGIHTKLALFVACLAIIEFLPTKTNFTYNMEALGRLNETYACTIDDLAEIREDLEISGEETAVFLTYDHSSNAFLIPLISYEMGFNSYTGTVDKSLAVANQYLPEDIREIQSQSDPEMLAKIITQIGERQTCDFIFFPYFDLREQNTWWPPTQTEYELIKTLAEETEKILSDYKIPVWDLSYYKIFDLRNFNASCIKESSLTIDSQHSFNTTLDVSGKKEIYLYGMAEVLEGIGSDELLKIEFYTENFEKFATLDVTELSNKKFAYLESTYEIPNGTNQVNIAIQTSPKVKVNMTGLVISAVNPSNFYYDETSLILQKYGLENIQTYQNIVEGNEYLEFSSDSRIQCKSLVDNQISSFEISMDLLIDHPEDPNNVTLISKQEAWANNMSFCIGMKEKSSFIAVSQDGQIPYMLWYDNSLICDGEWHKLQIIFNQGELKFYIDEILVESENCGFKNIYNTRTTSIQVGGGFSGKIKNVEWKIND